MSEVISYMYAQRTGRSRSDGRGGIEHEYVEGGARFWIAFRFGQNACLSGTAVQTLGTAA